MDSAEFLAHYGKKGMRWGQRHAQAKLAKADKKWAKTAYSPKTAFKIYNEAAGMSNANLSNINKKWAGKNITKPGKLQDAYMKEVFDDMNKNLAKVAKKYPKSPSGKSLQVKYNNSTGTLAVIAK